MKNRLDRESLRKWIKICTAILAVLMLRVWENVQALRLKQELAAWRSEADRLTYDNGRLQMQIRQYETPGNLEALAKDKFAMAPLDPSHRIGIQQ
jgi:cell division protein FtsL